MPLYDLYEQYRPALTPEELEQVRQATEQSEKLARQSPGRKVPGGYEGPEGFIADPLVQVHMELARKQAAAQLKKLPVMPEDGDISFRFPELDPVGKYSIIDMKFAHRYNAVQLALPSRDAQVQGFVSAVRQKLTEDSTFRALHEAMREAAQEHRLLTRASKLCRNREGRELLHLQARSLEVSPCVAEYDRLLQGMEYAAGIRSPEHGLPADVARLYQDELKMSVPLHAAKNRVIPKEIHVRFQNFENQLLQRQCTDPNRWNESTADQALPSHRPADVHTALQYYAMSTVSRALRPVLGPAEALADRVRIDGTYLRDMLSEASPDSPAPDPSEAVAAVAGALMGGRKVEALIPDAAGKLPDRPVPVIKDGYAPAPQHKPAANAWEHFVSRQGFYQEPSPQAEAGKGFTPRR